MESIRWKHRVEYAALTGILRLVGGLPERPALAVGYLVAWTAFYGLRYRRREVARRIREVFGEDCPPRRVRRIAWLSLRNLAFNAVELMRADTWGPEDMRKRSENYLPTVARAKELVARHGGLIVAVPHMGNWDLAGVACLQAGVPLFSIAARQRNPRVNELINRLRRVTGMVLLQRGSGTMREVLKRLRAGEALAILPDVRMRTPDLEIAFLGKRANIGRGMAQFACAAGVPVLPVIIRRRGWRTLIFKPLPAVLPDPGLDRDANVRIMTQTVFDFIEPEIRKTPEQWFWYNRRWILEPLDNPQHHGKKP